MSLESYYKVNFALIQHHKYSLTEIENLMPWEKEIYVTMLIDFLREEEKRMKDQQAAQQASG